MAISGSGTRNSPSFATRNQAVPSLSLFLTPFWPYGTATNSPSFGQRHTRQLVPLVSYYIGIDRHNAHNITMTEVSMSSTPHPMRQRIPYKLKYWRTAMCTSGVNADFGASSFVGGTLTHVLNRTHSVRIISGRLITPDMPLGGVVSR